MKLAKYFFPIPRWPVLLFGELHTLEVKKENNPRGGVKERNYLPIHSILQTFFDLCYSEQINIRSQGYKY